MKKTESQLDYEYHGALKDHCREFVRMKRAIGYKYNVEAALLRQFDTFTLGFTMPEGRLPKHVVLAWGEKRPHESDKTHRSRIHVVNMLAGFMKKNGYDAYVYPVLPGKGPGSFQFKPHIYSDDELSRFFRAADSMEQTGRSRYRHLIVPLLFRMLLCCGMRLSEALKLRIGDVNMQDGVLLIRETKFSKSRYVPMSSEMAALCERFLDETKDAYRPDGHLFPTPKGGRYDVSSIESIFRELLFRAGIPHGGRGSGPRIHDFRHTFSVRCLKKWTLNGKNVTAALPFLSAYLGHADLRGSESYLRLTADLYPHIMEQYEGRFGDIIPDGGIGDGHD